MKLGDKILKLRKEYKISQEQLAEKINVTRQTISNWELGETSPNPEQLKLLSKELKVSIDELLDNDVKDILVTKVSNTEQLAGIIIKILKFFGIAFIVVIFVSIISVLFFAGSTRKTTTTIVNMASTTCSLDNNDYVIDVASDGHFNCSNCSEKIQKDLKEVIDFSDVDSSMNNIEAYFISKNGICK